MKHLLQLFNELSLHPKNAKSLKGLILQLAIQGKLTENWRKENPDIETASELLKRILLEKNLLKNKKESQTDKSKIDEKFELPETWTWTRLGDLGHTQTGSTPPKKNPLFYGSFIPFISPADISNQSMKYPKEGLSEKGLKVGRLIPKNSLMMVCIGGSIGKCNINEIDVSCNQQINVITPIISYPIMIRIICQSPYFQEEILLHSSGSATPIINKGKWEKIPVPIPPLQEQKVIVSIVEELFAEVEQLEQKTVARIQLKKDYATSALQNLAQADDSVKAWQDTQPHFKTFFNEKANLRKLRETILQLAVQGKLTAHWRKKRQLSGAEAEAEVEPASELLKRITTEKQKLIEEKKIKKEKPLPKITEDDKPFVLPDGWEWCRWLELLAPVRYPMKRGPFGSSLRKADFVKNGVRVFEQYNPINNDPHWARYFVSKEKYESMKAFTAKSGDFLISCSGTLGRIVYLPEETMTGIINQALLKLTLNHDIILPEYFLRLFRSYYIQDKIWKQAKGMAQSNMVGVKELKKIVIPLPPLEEQKAIVNIVDTLMAECDTLENNIKQRDTLIEDLMSSCLYEMENENSRLHYKVI